MVDLDLDNRTVVLKDNRTVVVLKDNSKVGEEKAALQLRSNNHNSRENDDKKKFFNRTLEKIFRVIL